VLASAHIQALDDKAKELLAMKATLEHLVHCCRGDDRPECPILASLADDETAQSSGSIKGRSLSIPVRRRLAP
jgi:MerR family copper efflux transcriptional regulator